MAIPLKTAAQHLAAKVQVRGPDECWPWTGAIKSSGYGHFWDGESYKMAHREALKASGVEIPEGMHALHSCDNKICCNPAHLRPGSRSENVQDALARGQLPQGARSYQAKFTDEQVAEIRASSLSHVRLGIIYGVNGATIGKIKRGERYRLSSITKETN